MAGGLIEVRYEIVSTGPSYDTICIVVYSPGVLFNAEICVIGLSSCVVQRRVLGKFSLRWEDGQLVPFL